MKKIHIQLQSTDTLKKILRMLDLTDAQEIIFECQGSCVLLSDSAVLKKIKAVVEEKEKTCRFVTTRSFLKNILKSQKLDVLESLPDENMEMYTLADFLPKKNINPQTETEKNQEIKCDETSQDPDDEPVMGFSSSKIEMDEKKSSLRGTFFFLFVGLIGVLVWILIWISPKAVLTLKPEVSMIPITQNIIIRFPEGEISQDEENLPTVPGIFVENEVKEKQVFPTSGKRYDITNASGEVTLFNQTNKPKQLVPSRLSTQDGVIVRFRNPVTIPPKQGDTPGQLIVQVFADEYDADGQPIGNRGNILAGTELFFPALREELQELYYAKTNRGPLVGGSTLTHYFMAEDDIEKTRSFLEDTFRTRALDKLKEEVRQRSVREKKNYVLLEDREVLQSEIVEEVFPEDLVGEEVQTFDVFVDLRLKGVVFDQTSVVDILKEKVEETQDARKKLLYIDPVSAHYEVLDMSDRSENPDENWVKVSVQMKGIEMFDFHATSISSEEWYHSLKQEIAGKSVQEALAILNNFSEIESVTDVKVAPFWSENIPHLFDQIEFVVEDPV